MRDFLKLLEGMAIFGLLIWFIIWYVKMHFNPRYCLFFWLFTFSMICICVFYEPGPQFEIDPRTGYEIWQEKMKNYDAQRGY